MRPATFERIRASILQQLRDSGGRAHAESFCHLAGTDYDRAREVRNALEAAGVIRTYRDKGIPNHPLIAELINDPEERTKVTDHEFHHSKIADSVAPDQRIEMRHALVMVRTESDTYVMSDVTGLLLLHTNIQDGAERQEGPFTEKDVGRIRDFSINLSANAPGFARLPNNPPAPTTIKKEG